MNLYWSVYKNLEKELIVLSDQIHFDDNQLSVYSVKISELIIRCSVEIESIAKDLFLDNGGVMPAGRDLYFDTDCMEFLENKWLLSKKKVILSAQNFYFTNTDNKILTPLLKSNKRGTSGSDWKKAYQAVKHNRTFSLTKGNLKYLIRALAALYLLNIYYKNDPFDLGKDSQATSFPINLGSEVFSIKLEKNVTVDDKGIYKKPGDFEESVYFLKWTDESAKVFNESTAAFNQKVQELTIKHPKFLDFVSKNDISKYKGKNIAWEALGQDEYINLTREAMRQAPIKGDQLKYEAILNKNQI
jgi:hypothetical protein